MEIYTANCDQSGVVRVDVGGNSVVSPDALKLCAGAAESKGFLLVGSNAALYITNTQPDLAAVIEAIKPVAELKSSGDAAATGSPVITAAVNKAAAELKTNLDAIKLR